MQVCQTLGKWGNATAVRIPATLAKSLGFVPDRKVFISVEDDALVIRPAVEGIQLEDLLSGVTPDALRAGQ